MLNRIQLMGTLASLPDIHRREDGRTGATFLLTTHFYEKPSFGERGYGYRGPVQKKTEWHRVTVYREYTIQWIQESLNKGDFLFVEGRLCYEEGEDQVGQRRKGAHIVISHREGKVSLLRSGRPSSEEQGQGHQRGGNSFDPCLPEADQSSDSQGPDHQGADHQRSLPAFLTSPALPVYAPQGEENGSVQRGGNSFDSCQEEDPLKPNQALKKSIDKVICAFVAFLSVHIRSLPQ